MPLYIRGIHIYLIFKVYYKIQILLKDNNQTDSLYHQHDWGLITESLHHL